MVIQFCSYVMGLFFSRKFSLLYLFSKKLSNLWGFVSRATRQHDVSRCPHWQRYDDGCRQVVGYQNKELEVLVISAQKGNGMQFPKGGWESDESMEQAALRETIEEAGD
ncbi:hypothetical protein AAZX31_05G232500 [Glycine max]|nr:hypothetical protein GLYMA_05G247400v4 [Glycine max]KAH1079887.1 hypothetical protein GYH30_057022 [Glycine max]|eukprot:XP_006580391.1 nudix hydrolase 4-like isoform X1 [Glycine max]